MRVALLLVTASLTLVGVCLGADVIEEIIAKVNGDIITRGEVERTRRQVEAELRQRAQGAQARQVEEAVKERQKDSLRDRIDQLLLVQKGKELSINIDTELSKYLAEIRREYKIADDDKFAAFMKEQSGMTLEDFKNETRNSMLTQRVIRQEVGGKINVTKAEVAKYYEEHKAEFQREERVFLRQIVLSLEGKKPEEIAAIEKKAKDLVARSKKGERFGELARDNSDEQQSARQFGDIGGFKRGELNKQIEDQVFTANRGFITEPMKLGNALAIFRVEEIHKAGQATLEEVEQEVMERLYTPRMQPAIREYLTRLRVDAFLEIKDGYIDSGAAPGKNTAWTDPAQLQPQTVSKEEVASQTRRRRLLWSIPVPGTKTSVQKGGKTAEEKGESKSKKVKSLG